MTENTREPAIEVIGLTKHYDRLLAVDDISFVTYRGEAFGLLGPNGAGKSTIVKILTGLVMPTAGTVRVLGQPINHLKTRQRVGYLPELPTFHKWLRAREVLALVGLNGREQQKLGTFSKGMLQRIGLAQALINQPDLLILDELVSGLDPVGVRDLRDLLRRLKDAGTSIFLNSHQLADVEALCDRVAIINQGRILKIGSPATLFNEAITLEVRVNKVNPELLQKLRLVALALHQQPGTPTSLLIEIEKEEDAADVAELIHSCGVRLYSMAPRHHTLEQLFLHTIDEARSPMEEKA